MVVPLLHKKICPSRYGLKAAITVVTTVCIKSMAYVHNISLRWALFHEGKLRFNSNLRLVQHCRNSPANSWIANLVCFLGIVVCYSAAAVIVLECETVKDRTMFVTLPQTTLTARWLFAIAAGPQMPLALLLHASERLVNCIRDEAAWRKMAHKRGTRRESANPPVSADRSTSKEVESIPGLDQAYFRPYIVTSIVVFAVGGACACLAVFLSALAFWPRKGPQPATYGHLQTIVDLIDEWPKHGDETMYWGHKAGGTGWKETEPVNHAGVLLSGPPLEPIRKDELYS
ncbi:hypothetical protein OC835_006973, partial [Tilletia horrida]